MVVIFFLFAYVCVYMPPRSPELQIAVSSLSSMVETERRFSGRTASAINQQAILKVPAVIIYHQCLVISSVCFF